VLILRGDPVFTGYCLQFTIDRWRSSRYFRAHNDGSTFGGISGADENAGFGVPNESSECGKESESEGKQMELPEVDERAKLQFDYAWKWFESHQRQRMVMFYYYCIIVGVLANALITSDKEDYSGMRLPIGTMGVITSLAFLFFEIRNRGMCKVAEDIFEKLENEFIFPGEFLGENGNKMGPLSVDRRIGMREDQKFTFKRLVLKHKYWIRVMYGLVALYFLFVVIKAVFS
jgi:hypothetical protein